MYYRDGRLIFSPTDLTVFFESEFASWMDRFNAECRAGRAVCPPDTDPDPEDEEAGLIADHGRNHEKRVLDGFKGSGIDVAEIPSRDPDARTITLAHMRSGRDLVYQACLSHDGFEGYADFLVKTDGRSSLGDFHYEVRDSKLAQSPRPAYLIQLCAYAEMLESVQHRLPDEVALILGDKSSPRFQTASFIYFYQSLKKAFLSFQAGFAPELMPDPGESASHGRWSSLATQLLERADHLSRIARITRAQIAKLNEHGVKTMAGLAATSPRSVRGIDRDVLARLVTQAKLQLSSAGLEEPHFKLREQAAGEDPHRGLAGLPPASLLDVHFDMEGFPLADGGLEYLLGAVTIERGKPRFRDWWAHDSLEEKAAFEQFIDWVHGRWKKGTGMHVYHYAAYEKTAVRRLMGKYGTREDQVDDLLRNHVFVDLYTVVTQGLIIGTPGYSLKDIEHLYRGKREGGVTTAGGSIVAYERWLDSGQPRDWNSSPILREIREYNRVDCESLWELAEWLRELQRENRISYVWPESGAKKEDGEERKARPESELAERLLASAAELQDGEPKRIQKLVAWLIEFHRREDKPKWWRMFDRRERSVEELAADFDCLGGLRCVDGQQNTYSFDPDQDTKIRAGDRCHVVPTNMMVTVDIFDADRGVITLRAGKCVTKLPEELSLIPDEFIRTEKIQAALREYAESLSEGQTVSRAIEDLLARRPPRIRGHSDGPVIAAGETLPQLVSAAKSLDSSTLCIQGPPGTGKTFTAGAVITSLLKDGKRVGVMANSHSAIMNLIQAVVSNGNACDVPIMKVGGDRDHALMGSGRVRYVQSAGNLANLPAGPLVVAGTAWCFANEKLRGELDYLFIDEAGQVALANVVAARLSAGNIVLVGDQMQLAQPIQGTHPGESGMSALEYLLHDHHTIPPDRGVFLDVSYRMHPDICSFISDAVYDGRLRAAKGTELQRIESPKRGDAGRVRRESGIVFIPVDHEGNAQASDEEVGEVAAIADELLGRDFIDKEGRRRPVQLEDILFVAPFNMQVRRLKRRLGDSARIGSVDKFQGQEAPVVIVSMCSSTLEDSPRGAEFLLNQNRINVAISRAQCLAIVVASPSLLFSRCQTIEQMKLVNLFCRIAEVGSER